MLCYHGGMTEPTLVSMTKQDGYGAHKRGEHCEVCYNHTGRVGTWKLTFSDGSVKFYCGDHVPSFQLPSPTEPVESALPPTH